MTNIEINDQRTIREIQEEFHMHFPMLKIEFYKAAHKPGEGTANDTKISPEARLGAFRRSHQTGIVSIHGNLQVKSLESAFHDAFGLNAQVFRKSGDLWLQTTVTDDWTLSEQNERAKELSALH